MNNDTLANAMSKLLNSEKAGKESCSIRPASKTIKEVFQLMKDNGYIGDVDEQKDTKGNSLKVSLIGSINKCGAIKPRFPVKKGAFERFEKIYLPAKDFGIIIISTQKGMMSHIDAKKKSLGGKLISYCY
jgi:small subunit ribosomal protein S8